MRGGGGRRGKKRALYGIEKKLLTSVFSVIVSSPVFGRRFGNRMGVNEVDAHFQAALVLAERTFDRAWGEEEAKAAALAERQALELELQAAGR